MSDFRISLGSGFTAVPNLWVGVFVISNGDGVAVKTFDLGTTMEAMEAWVAGYVAGQVSTRDPGKVRMCGMVGTA